MKGSRPEGADPDRSARSPQEVAGWCRRFENLCRRRGIRVTAQRLAVYEALARDLAHPTADAIHARLRAGMSSLSPATVYRILEFLEREGLVRKVSTTEGVGRFDANLNHHQHLVCRVCGSMTDFQQELPHQLKLPRRGAAEFLAQEFDIRIVGICTQCHSARRVQKRVKAGYNK
jgi:Fur family transcriptional regulator, peroxide stress response regulator